MSMQLRWLASVSASAFHAAVAVVEGRSLLEPPLAKAITPPARELANQIDATGIDVHDALAMMAGLAHGIENNQQLVRLVLDKLRGPGLHREHAVSRIAGQVAELEAAMRTLKPELADELALRGEPLKMLFQARGPGLLRQVQRLLGDETLLAPSAEVALVYPALGGHGVAHLPTNSVRIEAVLANPHESLPEVVRLAWLLGQLQCDLPKHSDHLAPGRLPRLAALALMPPVLEAAEQVELATHNAGTLRLALEAWRLADSQANAALLAPVLEDWWLTFVERPTSWAVGLAALERMTEGLS